MSPQTDYETLDDFLIEQHPEGWDESFVEAEIEGTEDREHIRFKITNDAVALWAMRKLAKANKRIEEIHSIREEEIRKIDDWVAKVEEKPMRDVAYFTHILRDYALECRFNENDARKTITLPIGLIKTRSLPISFECDPDTYIPWAKANAPETIRIKETIDQGELKRRFGGAPTAESDGVLVSDDGEIIPGVRVRPADTGVNIEIMDDQPDTDQTF